jgi:predicted component of type VI protein secretion system
VSFAVVVLIFRIALVVLLYLFLAQVVRMVYRDLRATAAGSSFSGPAPAAPSARAGAVAQLVVLAAGKTTFQVGQEFRLRNPTLLGRDPANDISVDDDFVSAQHLRLLSGPTGWVAQDLNATNGTRLNGTRLTGTAPLKSGDILDIGRLKLRFVLDR